MINTYIVKLKGAKEWKVRSIKIGKFINGIDSHKRLSKDDENRRWYIREIVNMLEVEEYDIAYILDEIYSYSELDEVYSAINSLKDFLASMQKKDIKNGNRLKTHFYKLKNDFIEELKNNNQYIELEKVQTIEYKQPVYYEDDLYNSKQILYASLINNCNCSIKRAKEIIKILEEI